MCTPTIFTHRFLQLRSSHQFFSQRSRNKLSVHAVGGRTVRLSSGRGVRTRTSKVSSARGFVHRLYRRRWDQIPCYRCLDLCNDNDIDGEACKTPRSPNMHCSMNEIHDIFSSYLQRMRTISMNRVAKLSSTLLANHMSHLRW